MKKTFEFLLYSNSNNNFAQRELHQKRGHLSSPGSLSPIFTPTSYVSVKVLTACACVCLTDAEIKVVKILVRRPNLRKFDGAGLINQLLTDINDRRFSLTTGADIRVFVFRGWGPKLLLDQPTPALLFLYVSSNDINYQASVVWRLDNVIHWIKLYPVDNSIGFAITYPPDSDLSAG